MKALTIMEISTISSAVGTLGLAAASLYQLRRNKRDSVHPIVYPGAISFGADELDAGLLRKVAIHTLSVELYNYGSGPAIAIEISIKMRGQKLRIDEIYKQNLPTYFLNLSPGSKEHLEIVLQDVVIEADTPMQIGIRYRSVFRETFRRTYLIEAKAGQVPVKQISGSS